MLKRFVLPVALVAILSGCQQPAPAPSPSAVAESPSPSPSPSPSTDPARQVLDEYFKTALAGGSGEEFWCENDKYSAKSLLNVRAYKVLKEKLNNSPSPGAMLYLVQVDSTNQGGSPISKNWTILISPENSNNAYCMVYLRDASKRPEL